MPINNDALIHEIIDRVELQNEGTIGGNLHRSMNSKDSVFAVVDRSQQRNHLQRRNEPQWFEDKKPVKRESLEAVYARGSRFAIYIASV